MTEITPVTSFVLTRRECEACKGRTHLYLADHAGDGVNQYVFQHAKGFRASVAALLKTSDRDALSLNLAMHDRGAFQIEVLFHSKAGLSHGARKDRKSGQYYSIHKTVLSYSGTGSVEAFLNTLPERDVFLKLIHAQGPQKGDNSEASSSESIKETTPPHSEVFVQDPSASSGEVIPLHVRESDGLPEGAVYQGAIDSFDSETLRQAVDRGEAFVSEAGEVYAIFETAKDTRLAGATIYERRSDVALEEVRRDFQAYETTLPDDFASLPTKDKLKMAVRHDNTHGDGTGVFRTVPSDVVEVSSALLKEHAATLLKPIYYAKGLHYSPKIPALHEADRFQNDAYQITSSKVFDRESAQMVASHGHMSLDQRFFAWYLARYGDVPVVDAGNDVLAFGRIDALHADDCDYALGENGTFYHRHSGDVVTRVSGFNRDQLPDLVMVFQPRERVVRDFVREHHGKLDLSRADIAALSRPLQVVFQPDFTPARLKKWRASVAELNAQGSQPHNHSDVLAYQFKDETIEHYNNDLYFARSVFPDLGFDINKAASFMMDDHGPNRGEYFDWLMRSVVFDTPDQMFGFLDDAGQTDKRVRVEAVLTSPYLKPIVCDLTQKDVRVAAFKDISQLETDARAQALEARQSARDFAQQRLESERVRHEAVQKALGGDGLSADLRRVRNFVLSHSEITLERARLDVMLFDMTQEQSLRHAKGLYGRLHRANLSVADMPLDDFHAGLRQLSQQLRDADDVAQTFVDEMVSSFLDLPELSERTVRDMLVLKPQDVSYNPQRQTPVGVQVSPPTLNMMGVQEFDGSDVVQSHVDVGASAYVPFGRTAIYAWGESFLGWRSRSESASSALEHKVVLPFDQGARVLGLEQREIFRGEVTHRFSPLHETSLNFERVRDFVQTDTRSALEHRFIRPFTQNRTYRLGVSLPSEVVRLDQYFARGMGVYAGARGRVVRSGDGVSYDAQYGMQSIFDASGQSGVLHSVSTQLSAHNKKKAGDVGRVDVSVSATIERSHAIAAAQSSSFGGKYQHGVAPRASVEVGGDVFLSPQFKMRRASVGLELNDMSVAAQVMDLDIARQPRHLNMRVLGLSAEYSTQIQHKPFSVDAAFYLYQQRGSDLSDMMPDSGIYQWSLGARYRF